MNELPVTTPRYAAESMGRMRHLHFVGIGGAGMNGIAQVMLNLGYEIVKATEDRVWRLNRQTGEIAVCSLLEEQLLCTNSTEAIVPPTMTYADLQTQREQEASTPQRMEAQPRIAAIPKPLRST